MKKKLKIPKFRNEDAERDFWSKVDLSKYFHAENFEKVSFPNLKPTSKPISIRMPIFLLNRVKEKANELNVPYSALIKSYIKEGVFKQSLR